MIGDILLAIYFVSLAFGTFLALYGICGVFYYKVIKKSKLTISQILSIL